MAKTEADAFEVTVQYRARALRVVLKGLTNHLLRAVLLGLWATMDARDRTDFIAELTYYDGTAMAEMPPLSQVIAAARRAAHP